MTPRVTLFGLMTGAMGALALSGVPTAASAQAEDREMQAVVSFMMGCGRSLLDNDQSAFTELMDVLQLTPDADKVYEDAPNSIIYRFYNEDVASCITMGFGMDYNRALLHFHKSVENSGADYKLTKLPGEDRNIAAIYGLPQPTVALSVHDRGDGTIFLHAKEFSK